MSTTALTRTPDSSYPRFSTATLKCDCSAATSQIRFQAITATCDPDDKLFTIDVYIPFHPDEFGPNRYPATSNPSIAIGLFNTNGWNANNVVWSFDASYLRQGWNTLKMWAGDTNGTTNSGTLAFGVSKTLSGTGVDFTAAINCVEVTLNNMSGKSVWIDQLRRGAKANTKVVMGFDASGSAYNDRTFPDKVAPLFAKYGTTGYTTLTNIYEMIYAGGPSWLRQIELYETWGWDVLNHTWSHGGTIEGRNQTVTLARSGGNLITATCPAAHNIPVGKTFWSAILGAQDAAVNGVFKCVATTTTAFTFTSAGTDGAIAGTIRWNSYLSEVFNGDTSLQALLNHELGGISQTSMGVGFQRSAHLGAYPNNMVPELTMLKTAAADAGLVMARGIRGGVCMQNEFGIDNPLNFGSVEMGSGTSATTTAYVEAKFTGAVGRGDHFWTYGHYVLDESTLLPTVVNLEYPPGSGGNPNPPTAAVSGIGGWWYLGQIALLFSRTIGPAIAAGTAELMTPLQFADYVGLKAK